MGQILFWVGIFGAGATVIAAVISICVFSGKRRKLLKTLAEEYGEGVLKNSNKG